MVAVEGVVVVGPVTLLCVYYAYRLANTGRLYYLLSGLTPDRSPALADSESVTVEGPVTVDDEAPVSDRATDEETGEIAMYVWRTAFARSGQRVVDFRNWETRRSRATFASGVESGTFSVATGNGDVRVDPSWLRDVHDATQLSDVRPVGLLPSRTWHVYLWRSPYVHLTSHLVESSLERLRSVIDDDPDVDLSDDYFASKVVPEGTELTVHGKLSTEDGTPTMAGTDDTPLFVSDRGLDAIRGDLRRRARNYGVYLILASGANALAVLAFL
ncbi:hypothetical protein [Halorussus salinus]|uniref:hypothetical protein n=1 Tax=Halorussus salinus TaxID=1364935 RepID=UPI001092BA4A|nr:hypothetical protein [Halorussus salinus]